MAKQVTVELLVTTTVPSSWAPEDVADAVAEIIVEEWDGAAVAIEDAT